MMDWYSLGHAMWLVEAEGLRLLCDPLLQATHHGGLFELAERRDVDVDALRPDFILVSHAHGDHFDVGSLRILAQRDPDTVVLTPDELVAWAARSLGFHDVRLVPAGQRVSLDGPTLATTPSSTPDEWGVMIGTRAGVVWNHVDSSLATPQVVQRVEHASAEALGRGPGAEYALCIPHWQPMLEVAAMTGGQTAFPYRLYGNKLDNIAALSARHVVPGACGGVHAQPFAWLRQHVRPVSEARFLADARTRCPDKVLHANRVGAVYRVRGAELEVDFTGGRQLVAAVPDDPQSTPFDPMVIPPLSDPGLSEVAEREIKERLETWVRTELADALQAVARTWQTKVAVRLVLEVVYPASRQAWTFTLDREGCRLDRHFDEEWDGLNRIAASALFEVIEGRRHWGDVLLGGLMRGLTRAYSVDESGLTRLPVGAFFLYHAIGYRKAVERQVRWEVGVVQ